MENKSNIVGNAGLEELLNLDVSDLRSDGIPKPYRSNRLSPYEQSLLDSKNEFDKNPSEPSGESLSNGLAFHGQRAPQIEIQSEKPHHRVMLYLAAEGNTATEIAEKTGFSTVSVNNLLKQPWAAKRISQIIEESGRTKVELVLKGAALDAVQRLITEMENPNARPSERITAADKVLDRVYGKPNQPMTVSEGKSLNDMSDAEIQAELARIKGNRN